MKMKGNIDTKTEFSPTSKRKTRTLVFISINMLNPLNFACMFNAQHEFRLIYVTFILFVMVYHHIKAVLPSLALISAAFAAIDSISIAPLCQKSAHTINLGYLVSSYVDANSKLRF